MKLVTDPQLLRFEFSFEAIAFFFVALLAGVYLLLEICEDFPIELRPVGSQVDAFDVETVELFLDRHQDRGLARPARSREENQA